MLSSVEPRREMGCQCWGRWGGEGIRPMKLIMTENVNEDGPKYPLFSKCICRSGCTTVSCILHHCRFCCSIALHCMENWETNGVLFFVKQKMTQRRDEDECLPFL